MNTDFYYGLANLAFDDEVVASDSSEDEDAGPTAMSTRSSCPHHRRGTTIGGLYDNRSAVPLLNGSAFHSCMCITRVY